MCFSCIVWPSSSTESIIMGKTVSAPQSLHFWSFLQGQHQACGLGSLGTWVRLSVSSICPSCASIQLFVCFIWWPLDFMLWISWLLLSRMPFWTPPNAQMTPYLRLSWKNHLLQEVFLYSYSHITQFLCVLLGKLGHPFCWGHLQYSVSWGKGWGGMPPLRDRGSCRQEHGHVFFHTQNSLALLITQKSVERNSYSLFLFPVSRTWQNRYYFKWDNPHGLPDKHSVLSSST